MILHIDMDAFYASVEQLDNPWLKGKCVIVGGTSKRGVVSAASYEARRLGIHSAMPAFKARKKCPDAVFLPPRMERYKDISGQIMELLRQFTPRVEVVSIDEAYMDITGTSRLFGTPVDIGIKIKKKIREEIALTCSVGIAPSKFLAKIASDMDKPDGLFIIMPEEVAGFINTLPIGKVPGVGKRTHTILERMGIRTLGDVRSYSKMLIIRRLGKFGERLLLLSEGVDESPVTPAHLRKSASSERTLSEDTDNPALLKTLLLSQAEEVARQLRKLEVKARTVTLKLKHADFRQVSRSTTLPIPTRASETLYREGVKLLESYRLMQKVRLVGLGASGFVDSRTPAQMELFEAGPRSEENWEKVDRALDTISAKFGKGVVGRAGSTKED
ncbi:DNA polymerase IV (EC [Olavius algarvensis associated proteobacterium Delta 3]|nr:DNA polymerase IV (EC [Olavius algarvensis associated proteobacterium Delta 3]